WQGRLKYWNQPVRHSPASANSSEPFFNGSLHVSRKTHELDFADCLAQAGSEMFQNRRQFENRSFLIQFEKVRNRQDDEHSPAINHQQPLLARLGPVST